VESADYDLIIAGAGPAGSACAITAARAGAMVLLLEKDRFPRHKVCGEFVSPESLRLLEWLLGAQPFASRPSIGFARIFSSRKTVSIPISPAAQSISRFDLDAELAQAARAAGAQIQEEMVVQSVEEGPVFNVRTAAKTFTARAVVNASGRWSKLTQVPAAKNGDKWIGLKAHFTENAPSQSVDLYFFRGGYCGVQPVGPDTVNACTMVRASEAKSLEEVFSKHAELQRRSKEWKQLFPTITTSGLYFRKPQTEYRGMLMAGDAAGFIDPFAGDGISLALHGGALAARSLLRYLNNECSLERAQRDYHTSYMKTLAPAFRNAARVRMALSAPEFLQSLFIRLAGAKPFARTLVRSTRARVMESGDRA
jgi:geranylgeranyl reductase family protein